MSSLVITSGPGSLPYGALVVALSYCPRVMYMSRVRVGCGVVSCVDGVIRSYPGFVALSMGLVVEYMELLFVVLSYSVL